MRKKVKIKKLINVVIIFLLCVNLFASEPLAEQMHSFEYSEDYNMSDFVTEGDFKEEDILYELIDKREEFVRHFKLKDGRIVACQYECKIANIDINGNYYLINNDIVLKNNYLQTNNVSMNVKFGNDDHFLSFNDGNTDVIIDLVDGKNNGANYIEIEGHDSKVSNIAVSGLVTFENVYDGIDVIYQLVGEDIKESIIVKESGTQSEFYYKVNAFGYELKSEDGYIKLSNEKNNYYFISPFAIDNEGNSCENVDIMIADSETIVLSVDKEWLNDEERAFPVTIDPTIKKTLSGISVGSTSVCSQNPDSNYMYQYGALYVGKEASSYEKCRGAVRFSLPIIDESNTIISAGISLYQMGFRGNEDNYVKIAPITADLPLSSLTWNKLDGNIGKYCDYIKTNNWTKDNRFSFDITQIVTEWYKSGNNYGLVMVSESENSTYRYTTFTSSAHPSYISQHPYAYITYISHDGLEDYLTYQEASTIKTGNFYVGHFNGNLVYTIDDFIDTGNYLPLNIKHIYNHHQRKEQYNDGNMKFGSGFRLNVGMVVKHYENNDYYTLTDEDGTTHYYYKDVNTDNIYRQEFNSTSTLKINENNYLIEKNDCVIYFSKESGLITKIENLTNNKKQQYTYNSKNQLINISDGAGRLTYFNYDDNNFLATIIYDNDKTISYHYNQLGQLIQINFNDLFSVNYQYGSDYELNRCYSEIEGAISIEYLANNPKRVSKLITYNRDEMIQQTYDFDYLLYSSKVTYGDGYTMKYEFDKNGHTCCVSDNYGNAKYYSYENSGNNMHNLKIKSDVQSRQVNLIKNSKPYDTSCYSGNYNYENTNCFKLNGYIQQIISKKIKKDETYTLSLDVKGQKIKVYINDQIFETENVNKNEFERHSYTYLAKNDCNNITVKIENISDSKSTGGGETMSLGNKMPVYVKNLQLEEGSVSNKISLIENGNFNNEDAFWISDNTTIYDGVCNEGYKINGDLLLQKKVYQIIELHGGIASKFVVSGYIKSDCAVINSLNENGNKRNIGIKVELLDSSGKILQEEMFDCLSLSSDGQFLGGCFTSNVNYAKVKISLVCNYQIGTVFFDDIALYSEGFGSKYTCDEQGRTTAIQEKNGNLTEIYYKMVNVNGQRRSVVDYQTYKKNGYNEVCRRIDFDYNEKGLKKTETLINYNVPEGEQGRTVITEYSYDSKGNLLYTSINGQKKYESGKYTYDENYVSNYINEKGDNISLNYDTYGKLTELTDGNGNQTKFIYGNQDKKVSVVRGDYTTSYSYNDLGQMTNVDRDGQIYVFEYNKDNLLKKVKLENIDLIEYQYDYNGNIVKKIRGDYVEDYEYDQLDRLIAVKNGNDDISRYYYGNDGKLGLKKDNLTGGEIRYLYNINGDLIKEEHDDGLCLFGEYNEDNRLMAKKINYNEISQKNEYGYDELDYIEHINYLTNDKKSSVNYFKDDLLRTNKKIYKADKKTLLTASYFYLDMPIDKTTSILNTVKNCYDQNEDEYHYEYDGAGNIISVTVNRNNTVYSISYNYDRLGRLIRENNELMNETIVYSYDDWDNIISKKIYTYSILNELTEINLLSEDTYSYSTERRDVLEMVNGNEIVYNSSYEPVEYYDGTRLVWNKGKLTSLVKGETTVSFCYNSDGVRTKKNVIQTSGGMNSTLTTTYQISDNTILSEKREGMTSTNYLVYEYDENAQLTGFVYSQLNISMIVGSKNTLTSKKYIYLKDGVGNIVGIIGEDGKIKAEYKYDAYGNCSVVNCDSDMIGDINPFRYKDYYYDKETNMYYLGSRYYDSQIGRFISQDNVENIDVESLETNLYAYCKDNPIMYEDKYGGVALSLLAKMALTFVVSFISNAILNRDDGFKKIVQSSAHSWVYLFIGEFAFMTMDPYLIGIYFAIKGSIRTTKYSITLNDDLFLTFIFGLVLFAIDMVELAIGRSEFGDEAALTIVFELASALCEGGAEAGTRSIAQKRDNRNYENKGTSLFRKRAKPKFRIAYYGGI